MAKAEKSRSAKTDEQGTAAKSAGRKKASRSSNSGRAAEGRSCGKRVAPEGKDASRNTPARAEASPAIGEDASGHRLVERKQRKAAVTAASAVAPERVKSGSKKRGDASPAMKRASPKRRRPPAERSSLMDPRPGDVLHRREVVEVTKGWIHYRLTGSSDLKEMPKGLWPVLAKHPPLNSD